MRTQQETLLWLADEVESLGIRVQALDPKNPMELRSTVAQLAKEKLEVEIE